VYYVFFLCVLCECLSTVGSFVVESNLSLLFFGESLTELDVSPVDMNFRDRCVNLRVGVVLLVVFLLLRKRGVFTLNRLVSGDMSSFDISEDFRSLSVSRNVVDLLCGDLFDKQKFVRSKWRRLIAEECLLTFVNNGLVIISRENVNREFQFLTVFIECICFLTKLNLSSFLLLKQMTCLLLFLAELLMFFVNLFCDLCVMGLININLGGFINSGFETLDLGRRERNAVGFGFTLFLDKLCDLPVVTTKSERTWNVNRTIGSVEVGILGVGVERTGVFLAVVIFQRHIGFTDCPRGRGDEGGVGTSENGHFLLV